MPAPCKKGGWCSFLVSLGISERHRASCKRHVRVCIMVAARVHSPIYKLFLFSPSSISSRCLPLRPFFGRLARWLVGSFVRSFVPLSVFPPFLGI